MCKHQSAFVSFPLAIPKPVIPDAKNETTKVEKQLVKFCLRDNISWQAPGKKDYLIILENWKKRMFKSNL